ncbi:alanine:cation symporter family protein [Klebsiella pneumoniae]|nr:alanine:cation symporter family protein [Klebsiella pneumoniae]
MIGVFIDTIVICTLARYVMTLQPRPDNEYTLQRYSGLATRDERAGRRLGAGFIALIVLAVRL